MREALQEEVSKFGIWSMLPDGSRILTGFGKSTAALVTGILQSSDTPLHIDEIQKHIREHVTSETTNEFEHPQGRLLKLVCSMEEGPMD
jgi:hypothetical protein